MFRNLITLTGLVLHDPRPNESHPASLYTHVRLILPNSAFLATVELKSHLCIGECKIVFQNNVTRVASRFVRNDVIFVSGYLITGYIRDSRVTTNKIIANYAASVDTASFDESDSLNHIEISGLLGSDPVETSRPFHAWSVPLSPHLSPELHPLHPSARPQFRRYQVMFSELIADKAIQYLKNDLVLVCGHFIPSCACHARTSTNCIVANSMTRLGNSRP